LGGGGGGGIGAILSIAPKIGTNGFHKKMRIAQHSSRFHLKWEDFGK